MSNASEMKTPRQIRTLLTVTILISLIMVATGIYFLPKSPVEQQSFFTAVVGSAVGSALAFVGAVCLWRIERNILVQERTADRAAERLNEDRNQDRRSLQQCLSTVGQLQSLNYHLINDERHATSREKYLMSIRFNDAVSLVKSRELQKELEFIEKIIDNNDALDGLLGSEWRRLGIARAWLLRLIENGDGKDVERVRPANYDDLLKNYLTYEDYLRENNEAMVLLAEEQRAERGGPNPSV